MWSIPCARSDPAGITEPAVAWKKPLYFALDLGVTWQLARAPALPPRPAPARPPHQALCPRFTLLSFRRWLLNCFCFPFRAVILFSSSFPFCMQSPRRTDAQQTCADPASVASPLRSGRSLIHLDPTDDNFFITFLGKD